MADGQWIGKKLVRFAKVMDYLTNRFVESIQMRYDHTQRSPLWLAVMLCAFLCFVGAWMARMEPVPTAILAASGTLVLCFAAMFVWLNVRDEDECLVVRFGPISLFGTRIDYANILSAKPDRTKIIDGWGVHWIPGRGWTYNLWGFDCVCITTGKKTIRVGTDDVAGLMALLEQKSRAVKKSN